MSGEISLNFRDARAVRDALDAYARRQELMRSELLRVFVREGLAKRGAWPAVTIETGASPKGLQNGNAM